MEKRKGSIFRTAWALTVFVPMTLIVSSLILFGVPLRIISPETAHRLSRAWAGASCWASGVRVRTEGAENLPADDGYILAANHQAAFDILVAFVGLPVQFRWLSKESLFRIPMMGWAMTKAGHLPVDRGNSSKTPRLLKAAAKAIKAGTNVIIFPEGTRNRDPEGPLMEFKKGGFVLARLSGRPVVPVGLMGTPQALSMKPFRIHPAEVTIRIGKPLFPKDFPRKELDKFALATRDAVAVLTDRPGGPV